jgi:SLOG in TRPM, prokaryote
VAMNKQEIHFPNGNVAQAILPPVGTCATDLVRALDIPPRNAVIIIAGGASELNEQAHPDLIRLFTRGIAQVAVSTKALIIDGGTQAGVMAIMGQAVAEQQRRSTLLGVAPVGSVIYPGQSNIITGDEIAPLDPNHSYFVLVETDEWGGETDTMYELAKLLSEGCPSFAVLINGGSVTKSEILHNVRQERPIVVMEGSGRLADKIARLWQEKPSPISDPQLSEIIQQGNIHVFPLTGSTKELVLLTESLLKR